MSPKSESPRRRRAHNYLITSIAESKRLSMPAISDSPSLQLNEKERAGASLTNAPARGLLRRRVNVW